MNQKKLYVVSLGCDKNRVDTEEMLYNLSGGDFCVVADIAEADIAIINTCAFIESARAEAINTILEVAKYKAEGLQRLVVTGCLPQKYLAELERDLPEVDCFLGTNEYHLIAQKIAKLYQNNLDTANQSSSETDPAVANQSSSETDPAVANQSSSETDPAAAATSSGESAIAAGNARASDFSRVLTTPELFAYLKVADGCNNRCTFCTIPSIRGAYKSKPISKLVAEAKALKQMHDTKELILVAQDLTAYGKDLYGQYKLVELIKALSDTDIDLIRLMYCYPELITKELIAEIASNKKVARYIDIPLQHVDNGILRLMNRKSTFESISTLIKTIRDTDPTIAIRTTFMVGFPSETEQAFETLYKFLESNPLDHVGIFCYSFEEDTPSAKIKGHLSDEVKLSRLDQLGELVQRQAIAKNKARIGTKIKAMYYDIDYDRNLFVARSQFDAPDVDSVIYFSSPVAVEFGTQYEITITGVDGFDLIGELILS